MKIYDQIIEKINGCFLGEARYSIGEGFICVYVENEATKCDLRRDTIPYWEKDVLIRSEYIDSVTLFFYDTSPEYYSSLYIIALKEDYFG